MRGRVRAARLTVDAFAEFDDIPKFHGFIFFRSEVRKYARTEGNVFIEVALCETVATKFEFGRLNIG